MHFTSINKRAWEYKETHEQKFKDEQMNLIYTREIIKRRANEFKETCYQQCKEKIMEIKKDAGEKIQSPDIVSVRVPDDVVNVEVAHYELDSHFVFEYLGDVGAVKVWWKL